MNAAPDYTTPIALTRDCEAVLIPEGSRITLSEGAQVFVTQALGGAVTVNVNGNLARISGENVDALGMTPTVNPAAAATGSADGSVDEDLVWQQLSTCYDPEIPINIVELGLVYRCEVTPTEDGNRVDIDMTLTAPGCGMGPFLVEDVREKVRQVPNVAEVAVELVFDPPWNPEMMSEAARLETGLY
ncbi:MAG: putative Fe-S cluster assembly protein SufT [Gammaproteobacteria bacterium]